VKEKTEEREEVKEYKTPAIVEDDDSSNDEAETKKKRKKEKEREEKKEKKAKTPQGPVHIGSSEIVLKSELEPAVFAQCKEKMRQVKKSLKALDKPDPNQSPQEQVSNTRRCLVKIGRHIDLLLAPMSDDKARDWRSHLWFFVSNFTEFDAMKLFKLYRHAVKKDNEGGGEKEGKEHKEHKEHREKHKKEKRDKERHREKEKENVKEEKHSEKENVKVEKRSEKEDARIAALKREERRSGSREGRSEDREAERLRDDGYRNSVELSEQARYQEKGGYGERGGYSEKGFSPKGGYGERKGYSGGGGGNSRGYGGDRYHHQGGYNGYGGYGGRDYRGGGSGYNEKSGGRERWNDGGYNSSSRDKWGGGSVGGYRPQKRGYPDDGYEEGGGYNRGSREEDSNEREEGELGSEADYVRDAQDA